MSRWLEISPQMFKGCSRQDLICEIQKLRQLLVDADAVSRARFNYYGLCDSIDNNGAPYPSQFSAEILERARGTVTVDPNLARHSG